MLDHLRVHCRLEEGTGLHEFAPEQTRVRQVAVMGQRQPAEAVVGVKRLHIAQNRLASRRVTVMPDRRVTGHPVDHIAIAEDVANQAHRPVRMKALAVIGHDAGGFLSAMLQGV